MTATPLDEHRWENLTFAERFTVWTLRLWLADALGNNDAAGRSRAAFARFGADDALVPLERLMHVVSTAACRPIRLAPVTTPALSADEALLLDALAVAQIAADQAGEAIDSALALRPMFTPAVCRSVGPLCDGYARSLSAAGLDLTARLTGRRHPARPAARPAETLRPLAAEPFRPTLVRERAVR